MSRDDSPEQLSDQELVRGLIAGNSRAVEYLLNKCLLAAGGLFGKSSPHWPWREDVVRDIAVAILESLRHFEFHCSLNTWIWQVGAKRYADWVRREVNGPTLAPLLDLPDTQQQTVAEAVAAAQRKEFLGQCLMQAPEPYRTTLSLFYLAEHSCREVAEALGVSEGTVMSRLGRGRELLREMIPEDWDWE